MNSTSDKSPAPFGIDPDVGRRLLLSLGFCVQLGLIAGAVWPTVWLLLRLGPRCAGTWQWTLLIVLAVLVFNYAYAVGLLILRVLVPVPREGRYEVRPGEKPPRPVIVFLLNVLLLKVRYEVPWARTFLAVIVRTYPLKPLFARWWGPHTSSVMLGDIYNCLDPWLVYAGRNVMFGFNCTISGHAFDRQGLYVQRVTIGDGAVIGGEALIAPGVQIGARATIMPRASVLPDTRCGAARRRGGCACWRGRRRGAA